MCLHRNYDAFVLSLAVLYISTVFFIYVIKWKQDLYSMLMNVAKNENEKDFVCLLTWFYIGSAAQLNYYVIVLWGNENLQSV